ncbi:hypothetical protein ABE28_002180 [Peribacillus muralis]|uniref:DNA-binding protein n=1 Tax=Peribacillus muralis TaxID=264697 RepID=A0A1B3XIV2_9BACI|nr:hypothetical protein [Peribacillus muralis]AOH53143.1 hypothetical protein ABE28_002180 [Peribacillus muralis]
MRKAYGIKSLIVYLESVNHPITEEEVNDLIVNKKIPHLRPINNLLIFNLDHIDGWLRDQPSKP